MLRIIHGSLLAYFFSSKKKNKSAILLLILQIFTVRAQSDSAMHNSTVIEENSTTVSAIDQENQFTSELSSTTEALTPMEKSDFNTTDDIKLENQNIQLKIEPEEEIKNETNDQTREEAAEKTENITAKPKHYSWLESAIAHNISQHQHAISSVMANIIASYLSTITSIITLASQWPKPNRTRSFEVTSSKPTPIPSAGNTSENPLVQRINITEVPPNTTIDIFGSSESLTDDIIDADYDFDDLEYENENITKEFGIFRMDLEPTTVSTTTEDIKTVTAKKKTKKISSQRSNHRAISEQNIENLFSHVNFSLNSNSSRKTDSASQKLPFSSKYSRKITTTRIPRVRNHKKLHVNHTKARKVMKKRQVPLATDYDLSERPDLASYFRNTEIIRENYLNSGKGAVDYQKAEKKENFPGENWRDLYGPYAMSIENHREAILPPENTHIEAEVAPSDVENPPAFYFIDDVDYSQLQNTRRLPVDGHNKNIRQQIQAIEGGEQSTILRQNKNLWTIGQSVESKRKKKSNAEPTVTKNNKTGEKRLQRGRNPLYGHKTSSKNNRTKNRKNPRKGKPRNSQKNSRTRSKTRGHSKQSKRPSHQHKHHQARSTFY